MACCSSFRLLFLWFFLFFCFLSVQPSPVFVFLCFFFSLPYMLCPSLRILCFLPPLPLLCSAVFFFFFFVLPGFIPLFPPPGFFRFSLSPLVCSLFQFFPLFFFFFSGLSLYTLCPSPAQEEDDGDKGMRCCWLNGSSLLCVFSFSSLC
jgi:hypothetical protein